MIQLTTAEWRIMHCLWAAEPLSVRDVYEQLRQETGWSYSTVKTLMSRLAEKQTLTVERRGNTNFFRPRASRSEAQQSAVGNLLEQAFGGGASALVHYLIRNRRLQGAELDELREMLAQSQTQADADDAGD